MKDKEQSWYIKHIFDGEFGCEENTYDKGEVMVSVTLVDQHGNERYENVPDSWLTRNSLDVGSSWPDFREVRIETAHLVLKKATLDDWKNICDNLWSHADSAKYMLWEPTLTEEAAIARMKRTLAFQKNHKYALFVYEKKTGQAIGFAGMREIEAGIYEETGIAIGPLFSGNGYATEILAALVDEAGRNGARQFQSSCRTENGASHRVQEKCGFQFSHFEACIDPRTEKPYVLEHNYLLLTM